MKDHPVRPLILAWAALLGLLSLTLASAYVPLGWGNIAVNYGIALLKAGIVMVIYMHARSSGGFVRLLSIAGFAWLLVLGVLGMTDYITREPSKAVPPAVQGPAIQDDTSGSGAAR